MYPSTAYSTVAALELYHPPEIRAKTPLQNVTVTTCCYLCTLQQKTPTTAASVTVSEFMLRGEQAALKRTLQN